MTIASEITKLNTNLEAAYTAVDNKGGTLPSAQNFDNLATAIGTISGGGGSGTTDVELTRFKDDTNTEIGTHFCNFTDGNGNTYKVILLDAQYRNASTQWTSQRSNVTDMPLYSDLKLANVWEAGETATTNTQLILDWCTANSYTSTACSHCRSKSFTIGGVTYYGQLPNALEVFYIARNYNSFDAMDVSASSYSSLNFSSAHNIWSSSQFNYAGGWSLYSDNGGALTTYTKTSNYYACPVLEIPA